MCEQKWALPKSQPQAKCRHSQSRREQSSWRWPVPSLQTAQTALSTSWDACHCRPRHCERHHRQQHQQLRPQWPRQQDRQTRPHRRPRKGHQSPTARDGWAPQTGPPAPLAPEGRGSSEAQAQDGCPPLPHPHRLHLRPRRHSAPGGNRRRHDQRRRHHQTRFSAHRRHRHRQTTTAWKRGTQQSPHRTHRRPPLPHRSCRRRQGH